MENKYLIFFNLQISVAISECFSLYSPSIHQNKRRHFLKGTTSRKCILSRLLVTFLKIRKSYEKILSRIIHPFGVNVTQRKRLCNARRRRSVIYALSSSLLRERRTREEQIQWRCIVSPGWRVIAIGSFQMSDQTRAVSALPHIAFQSSSAFCPLQLHLSALSRKSISPITHRLA